MKRLIPAIVAVAMLVPGVAMAETDGPPGPPPGVPPPFHAHGGDGGDGGDAKALAKVKINIKNKVNVNVSNRIKNTFVPINVNINKVRQDQEQEQAQKQIQKQLQLQGQQQNNKQRIDPRQTTIITFNSPPDFLAPPGFVNIPGVSRPYTPTQYISGPVLLPTQLTRAEAEACRERGVDDEFDGAGFDEDTDRLYLVYLDAGQKITEALSMANYAGTVLAESDGHSYLATVCEAALVAMDHGADRGYVTHTMRPRNRTTGWGIGTSASPSVQRLGAASTPYAISGVAGFGTGRSSAYVQGDLLLHITAFRSLKAAEAAQVKEAEMATSVSFELEEDQG